MAAELGLTGAGGRGRHGARGHGEDGEQGRALLSSLRVAAAAGGREGAMGEGESDAGVGGGHGNEVYRLGFSRALLEFGRLIRLQHIYNF